MQNLSQITQEITEKQKEINGADTKIAASHQKNDLDLKTTQDSVTNLNSSAPNETAAAPKPQLVNGITIKSQDYNDFSKKSILNNIQHCYGDLSDVLVIMANHAITIDAHYEEYLKISQDYPEFKKLIQAIHSEVTQIKMIHDGFDRAQKLFKKGKGCILYDALTHFEKRHLKLLKGIDITPQTILICLADLNTVFFEVLNKTELLFNSLINDFLHIKGKPPTPIKMVHLFTSVIATNVDMHRCLANFAKLFDYAHSKLLSTICRYILIEANKQKVIKLDMDEKNSLIEKLKSLKELNTILLTLKNQFNYTEDRIHDSLWTEKNSFQVIYDDVTILNNLHEQVIKIRNFSQSLSVSVHLIQGFCRGGIRDWSKKPISATSFYTSKTDSKSKLEFETIEIDNDLGYLQDNQVSFIQSNQSSDHFFINAKRHTTQVALYDEKIQSEFNSLKTSQEQQHFLKTQSQKNTPEFKKFIDDMIEAAHTTSEQNFHQVTIEVSIFSASDKPGHSIGFKFISTNNVTGVYFCDYNFGEFYSNNLPAFKDWFRQYFHISGYALANFSNYSINIIKPKKIFSPAQVVAQAINEQMFKALSYEINNVNIELKLQLPTTITTHITKYLVPKQNNSTVLDFSSKALLCGFKNYLNSKNSHEDLDEFYRTEIKKQLTLGRKDDSKSYSAALSILNFYDKIISKNADDHVSVLVPCFELSGNIDPSHGNQLSTILKRSYEISAVLVKEDPAYDILQVYAYFNIAKTLMINDMTLTWSDLSGPKFFMQYYNRLLSLKNGLENKSEFKEVIEKSIHVKNALDSGNKKNDDLTNIPAILEELDQLWSNNFFSWSPSGLQEIIQRIMFGQVEEQVNLTDNVLNNHTAAAL